jgi:carboxypeptidase Q
MKQLPTFFLLMLVLTQGSPAQDAESESIARRYSAVADQIIKAARNQNDSYLKLQELCDDIGNRLSGSESLDRAIEWAQETMRSDGHENVRAEKVMVNKWVRGKESCELVSPRQLRFNMLGLGGSVGTPPDGITAEVLVVRDKAELDSLPDEAIKGKIVVFDFPMPQYSESSGSGYGQAVAYRGMGAQWAAERGGVAALVRSVTAYSLDTPHTGAMRRYTGGPDAIRVPAAAITIEAATMLHRLQDRDKHPVVKLSMEAADQGEVPSANVLAEIVGSELPEEIVVIGGHIDSWDVGQGAQDDGCGCVAAMEALNVLRKLNLKPRRTIRVVLWTNEENGIAGATSYAARHHDEVHVAGIESDSGGFKPEGFDIEMDDDDSQTLAVQQLTEIVQLLQPIGATRVVPGYSGTDVGQLKPSGTACLGLKVDGRLYFNSHHTWADTVDKVNPQELTDCVSTVAVAAYVIADMPNRLGHPSDD